jgi:hypothetical protein
MHLHENPVPSHDTQQEAESEDALHRFIPHLILQNKQEKVMKIVPTAHGVEFNNGC